MKPPFPLPSAMVLAFQRIFSSLRMILLTMHPPYWVGAQVFVCRHFLRRHRCHLRPCQSLCDCAWGALTSDRRRCHLTSARTLRPPCVADPGDTFQAGHRAGLSRATRGHSVAQRARSILPGLHFACSACGLDHGVAQRARSILPGLRSACSSRRRRASTWVPAPVPGTSLHAALLPAARSCFDSSGCPAKGCCCCPSSDKSTHYGHPG
jgi:hypothetical protein